MKREIAGWGQVKEAANMIDTFDTLSWLNAIDSCSYLNNEVRRLIQDAAGLGPRDSRVRLFLERLRNTAHASDNPREKAEILLYGAAIGYWRGLYPQAICDAREAVLSYENDDHRHAVALWILGLNQWELLHNHDAYRNWVEAKKIFKQCETLFQHFPNEKSWYKNRLLHMEVKLAAHPEEILTWLNYFERSSLRPPTRNIMERVQDRIREHAYSDVHTLMPELQKAISRSEEIYERAEIYLEFGLAFYQMGNNYFAIESLKMSVENFSAEVGIYHKQVVARCMLGALAWMQESLPRQAELHWICCIDEFEKLRRWANRDNLQEKEEWYAQHRDILRAALFEQRKKNPEPLNPDGGIPEENGPQPHPSAPHEEKTYSYQDLLSKVLWDHATADRLIEFERKKAPTAHRNELIRRAIERWIRDNQ